MPFIPLTPEEEKLYNRIEQDECESPEHNPPWFLLLDKTSKRKCPKCGKETIVFWHYTIPSKL